MRIWASRLLFDKSVLRLMRTAYRLSVGCAGKLREDFPQCSQRGLHLMSARSVFVRKRRLVAPQSLAHSFARVQ